jgi:dTDP-4-dehydrorhamnose reductase
LSIPMIHISTDAVFDGSSDIYTESDPPRPLSLYASTKLDGEQAVSSANPKAIITRVNFFGWSITRRRSLAEWFYNQLSTGQPVKGFTDIYFCPLLVDDLADVLVSMIKAGLSGLYHVVGAESVSKYDFGRRIATKFDLDANLVHPASVLDGNLKAARSPNLNLSIEKLTRDLHIQIPGLDEQIARFHQQFADGLPEQLVGYCPDHGC